MSIPEPNPNEASAYTPSRGPSIASEIDGDQAGENTAAKTSSSGRILSKSVKAMEAESVQNANTKRKAIPAATTSNKRVKTTEAYEAQKAEMKGNASDDVAAGKQRPQKRKRIQPSPNATALVPVAPVDPIPSVDPVPSVAPAAGPVLRYKLKIKLPLAPQQPRIKLKIKNSSSSPEEDKTARKARLERERALRIEEIEEEKRVLEVLKARARADEAKRHEMRVQEAQESEERAREAQQDEIRVHEALQAQARTAEAEGSSRRKQEISQGSSRKHEKGSRGLGGSRSKHENFRGSECGMSRRHSYNYVVLSQSPMGLMSPSMVHSTRGKRRERIIGQHCTTVTQHLVGIWKLLCLKHLYGESRGGFL